MCVVANFDESGIIGIHPCAITSHSLRKRFMAKSATAITIEVGGVKESILAVAPGRGGSRLSLMLAVVIIAMKRSPNSFWDWILSLVLKD